LADHWAHAKAADVQPGDRIRTADGTELVVTRIEPAFFGRADLVAFIEDTPERWFKRPVTIDADIEILVPEVGGPDAEGPDAKQGCS
jgi:hypothetical protein